MLSHSRTAIMVRSTLSVSICVLRSVMKASKGSDVGCSAVSSWLAPAAGASAPALDEAAAAEPSAAALVACRIFSASSSF